MSGLLKEGAARLAAPSERTALRIALVNNMPDEGLKAASRQFEALVTTAAPGAVALEHFHFETTPREAAAKAWLDAVSRPVSALDLVRFDAVVVTGAEPRAASLRDEAYYTEFVALAERALAARAFVLFSCLAAHAAALHFFGVERRPLETKLSGVFEVERFKDHERGVWLPDRFFTPHSRWNTLPVGALIRSGARLVSGAAEVGADAFTFDELPRFLFLQGHPEYEADTLLREFRRDLGRSLAGLCAPPSLPVGVTAPADADALARALDRVSAGDDPALARIDALLERTLCEAPWRQGADALVGALLSDAAAARGLPPLRSAI
jgi:homoserine O-succinyltransferase